MTLDLNSSETSTTDAKHAKEDANDTKRVTHATDELRRETE